MKGKTKGRNNTRTYRESSCWELCGRKLHHNLPETPFTSNELLGLKAMDVRRSKEWNPGPTPFACLLGRKRLREFFDGLIQSETYFTVSWQDPSGKDFYNLPRSNKLRKMRGNKRISLENIFPRISVYHFLIFYRNSLFYAKIKRLKSSLFFFANIAIL